MTYTTRLRIFLSPESKIHLSQCVAFCKPSSPSTNACTEALLQLPNSTTHENPKPTLTAKLCKLPHACSQRSQNPTPTENSLNPSPRLHRENGPLPMRCLSQAGCLSQSSRRTKPTYPRISKQFGSQSAGYCVLKFQPNITPDCKFS